MHSVREKKLGATVAVAVEPERAGPVDTRPHGDRSAVVHVHKRNAPWYARDRAVAIGVIKPQFYHKLSRQHWKGKPQLFIVCPARTIQRTVGRRRRRSHAFGDLSQPACAARTGGISCGVLADCPEIGTSVEAYSKHAVLRRRQDAGGAITVLMTAAAPNGQALCEGFHRDLSGCRAYTVGGIPQSEHS